METNHITLDSVVSSQIDAVGHDPLTSTLAVQFKAKKDAPASVYHYANVEAAEFEALKTAESPGSHFAKNIKAFPQKYPCKRIPAPEVEV